jgi:uncharacterized membrane protein YqhA
MRTFGRWLLIVGAKLLSTLLIIALLLFGTCVLMSAFVLIGYVLNWIGIGFTDAKMGVAASRGICAYLVVGFAILIIVGVYELGRFIRNTWREASERSEG